MAPSFKKLKLSYEYHKIELAEVEVEFEKRKKNFNEAYTEHYNELPPEMQRVVEKYLTTQTKSDAARNTAPPQSAALHSVSTREIFKEIAKHIHPDKHTLRDSQYQEEMARLFKRAQRFAEEENWLELHTIAQNLGVKIPPPSEDKLEDIHKKIEGMCEQMKATKTTVAWKWGEVDSAEQKKHVMSEYYKNIFGII
jgi:hypothetical protein